MTQSRTAEPLSSSLPQPEENTLLQETPYGWAAACWTPQGLAACAFGRASPLDAVQSLTPKIPDEVAAPNEKQLAQWRRMLAVLKAESEDELLDIAIDTRGYTEFQSAVVEVCRRIPRGETATYGELAASAGRPRAARAVGTVMSQNRFPLVVPCHRVVASNSLGGFSAPEGLSLKRRLLRMEGAQF